MNRSYLFALIALAFSLALVGVAHAAQPTSYAGAVALLANPQAVDAQIPQNVRGLLGTNDWLIIIGGAGTDYYWMRTEQGHVVATGRGRRLSPAPTATIMTTRQTIDQILQSTTPGIAALAALQRGSILIQYSSAASGWRLRMAIGAARVGLFGQAQMVSQGKQNGEVCQHGGECESGNCVGMGQGPPWTYGCSCDPFVFRTACTR